MKNRTPALLEWAKRATDDEISSTGTTRAYLKQIAYGHKTPSAEVAARIELTTAREVTRKELRPDDWHVIWPELLGPSDRSTPKPTRPDADAVPAEQACTDVQATPPSPKRAGQPRTATAS